MLALSMSGCTSFLNVETLGKSTIAGFFSDIDGLKAAGLGLHRLVTEFYDDQYIRMGEFQGDNLSMIRVNASLAMQLVYDFENAASDNSGYPYTVWKSGYEICTNANNILFYGEQLYKDFPDYKELIDTHFGYAYFARALAIFDLCNVYAMPSEQMPAYRMGTSAATTAASCGCSNTRAQISEMPPATNSCTRDRRTPSTCV